MGAKKRENAKENAKENVKLKRENPAKREQNAEKKELEEDANYNINDS